MPEIIVHLGDKEVQRFVSDKDNIVIGRARESDILIENLSVSRVHARILRKGDLYYLEDANSANGTWLNDRRIESEPLYHGDRIRVGKHELVYHDSDDQPLAPVNNDFDQTILVGEQPGANGDEAPAACLYVSCGRQRAENHPLRGESFRIGRADDADLHLSDWFVDQEQALLLRERDGYRLLDHARTHPTLLNGQTIGEGRFLAQGDIIQAGMSRILYSKQELERPQIDEALQTCPLVAPELPIDSLDDIDSPAPATDDTPLADGFDFDSPPTLDLGEEGLALDNEDFTDTAPPHTIEAPQTDEQEPEELPEALADLDFQKESPELQPDDQALAQTPPEPQDLPEFPETGEDPTTPPHISLPEDESTPLPETEAQADEILDEQPDEEPALDIAAIEESLGAQQPQADAIDHSDGQEEDAPPPAELDESAPEIPDAPEPEPEEASAEEAVADPQIALLEKGLQNPSEAVRRISAQRLKQLTGRDYEY